MIGGAPKLSGILKIDAMCFEVEFAFCMIILKTSHEIDFSKTRTMSFFIFTFIVRPLAHYYTLTSRAATTTPCLIPVFGTSLR